MRQFASLVRDKLSGAHDGRVLPSAAYKPVGVSKN